jgi:selenophosphate synthase
MPFDLLTTVEYGGCSAKLSPVQLAEALKDLPRITHERLLVDISTHDDAGVWKLTDDIALIQTVDFFPPICSDPYEFGQIAAANALSDVYAMGGRPINALNIVMFPQTKIPLDALKDILRGGMDKVTEANAVIVGGHTIDDYPPNYGVRCATDVTGFGLIGHALKLADASRVTIEFNAESIPLFDDAYRLIDMGCIPGASFRNQAFAEDRCEFSAGFDYNVKMLLMDPQTSGGLLFTVAAEKAPAAVASLKERGFPHAAIVGRTLPREPKALIIKRAI